MSFLPSRIRALRWLAALIASLACFQIGQTQYAFADTVCGLSDVNRYHAALQSETVEVTPAYLLTTARAFIKACPDRWETREAHLVAARGALDSGRPSLAAEHYTLARAAGGKLSPHMLMDEAVALNAAKRFAESNAVRNRAVYDWLAALDAKALATLSVKRVSGGSIYTAEFHETDDKVSAVWLAVPKGAGLPAAMVIRRDPQRSAWRSLRRPGPVPDIRVAEFQTCRAREVRIESEAAIAAKDVEARALSDLKAYLKNPANIPAPAKGKPVESCLWLETMLYTPAK